jgi:hypothetical protein
VAMKEVMKRKNPAPLQRAGSGLSLAAFIERPQAMANRRWAAV